MIELSSRHAGVCVVAALAIACSELAPGTDRLAQGIGRQTADSGAGIDPGGVDPVWGCLGQVEAPSAVPVQPEVTLSLRIIDTNTDRPPSALSVRACPKLDVECMVPLSDAVSVAADGFVHITTVQNFDGFLEITSPGYVPTLFFVNPPLTADRQDDFAIVTTQTLISLAALANVPIDAALGHLLIRTFDCEGEQTSGVEFSNDKGGQPFTFVQGLPQVGTVVTTTDGIGGYVNVPVGYVVVTGREVAHDASSGTASVLVRAGSMTYSDVRPP
jgi:hypothetical protein